TDLDHQVAGPDPGLLDQLSRQPAPGQKMLPELGAPRRAPGHGRPPCSYPYPQPTAPQGSRQANCPKSATPRTPEPRTARACTGPGRSGSAWVVLGVLVVEG